jgi:hypothetical protein
MTYPSTHRAAPGEQGGVRATLSLLSGSSAAIHFAVIGGHFDEYWVFGVFFLVIARFQAAWAVLIVAYPSRPMLLIGAIVDGGNRRCLAVVKNRGSADRSRSGRAGGGGVHRRGGNRGRVPASGRVLSDVAAVAIGGSADRALGGGPVRRCCLHHGGNDVWALVSSAEVGSHEAEVEEDAPEGHDED